MAKQPRQRAEPKHWVVLAIGESKLRRRCKEVKAGAAHEHVHDGILAWGVKPSAILDRDAQTVASHDGELGLPVAALAAQHEAFATQDGRRRRLGGEAGESGSRDERDREAGAKEAHLVFEAGDAVGKSNE